MARRNRWPRFAHWLHVAYWAVTRPLTVGVRTMLISDGQVVLVRHTYQNAWYFPGGGAKRRETLERAARREASEEAGAELGELVLFGAYSSFSEHKSDHVVVFLCHDFAWL